MVKCMITIDPNEVQRIRTKYKDRVPCLVEVAPRSPSGLRVSKTKYLVPLDFTFGQFVNIVRKYFSGDLSSTDGLFWFIIYENKPQIVPMSKLMSQLDKEYSIDGALYIKCSAENTFGSC